MAQAANGRNTLERWEVALIKAMQARGGLNDQGVLAYFTRPTRTINHRLISQIRSGTRYPAVAIASNEDLELFLRTWPDVDPVSGLSLNGDELLIKAREAMIAAVRTFNGAGLQFRAELFIVTAVIAWTYLMHAYFKRENVDYRYKKGGKVLKTKHGADKYWELTSCLDCDRSPLPSATAKNLHFLIGLRHEIEHRSTSKLDVAISAALQACCINFNAQIAKLFGAQFALERDLPIALQLVTFSPAQRSLLKAQKQLPAHIQTMMSQFFDTLTEDEQKDPRFAYRVAFVQKVGKPSKNDFAVEFIDSTDERAVRVNAVLVKDVDKARFSASQVVTAVKAAGFPKFTLHQHTQLWKTLSAKDPAKGFGKQGVYASTWEWFQPWIARVQQYCEDQGDKFR